MGNGETVGSLVTHVAAASVNPSISIDFSANNARHLALAKVMQSLIGLNCDSGTFLTSHQVMNERHLLLGAEISTKNVFYFPKNDLIFDFCQNFSSKFLKKNFDFFEKKIITRRGILISK
jgi:hypothetical protein